MSDPFLGEIKMFGGNFAPQGYAFCSGSLMSIAQNTALFSLLGTTYGGDGRATFGLPDFQGRSPVHWGQGAGLSLIEQGEAAGVESVTLLNGNLPSSGAPLIATSTEGTTNVPPANGYLAAVVDKDLNPVNIYATAATTPVPMHGSSSGGASLPLATRSPYLAVSFIIALQGVFPARQ